ncbi:hypothetical protein D3C87_2203690 [compost metagenome]
MRQNTISSSARPTATPTATMARLKFASAWSIVACCWLPMYLPKSFSASMKAALRGVPYSLFTM